MERVKYAIDWISGHYVAYKCCAHSGCENVDEVTRSGTPCPASQMQLRKQAFGPEGICEAAEPLKTGQFMQAYFDLKLCDHNDACVQTLMWNGMDVTLAVGCKSQLNVSTTDVPEKCISYRAVLQDPPEWIGSRVKVRSHGTSRDLLDLAACIMGIECPGAAAYPTVI